MPSTEGLTYGWSGGGSLVYEWDWGLGLGAGVNHAPVQKARVAFGSSGIDGPAQAWIVGLKVHRGPVYLAGTYVEHRNHDTDDEGRYFDGRGVELLLRYAWTERFRVSAGLNHMETFRRRPGSQYDIRTGLFSLEYSFRDPKFRNVLYAQVLIEGSHQADGTPYSNVYVVGGRYSFDF